MNDIRAVTRSQNRGKKSPNSPMNWIQKYSVEEMKLMQKEDADLKPLFEWKTAKSLPKREEVASLSPATRKYWLNWTNIIWQEGVLYQQILPIKDKNSSKLQLLVPKKMQDELLTTFHDHIFAGHFGVKKTTMKIKEKFHWYRMREDIRNHIRHCPSCNKQRAPQKQPRAALQNYQVGYPLDRIALDVMGPFPKSKHGNRYILVIGDHFTRWMEAYPLPNQYAEKVAEKLVKNL